VPVRPFAARLLHGGGIPRAVQVMPRPPYDPIALNYLLATGWDRGSCPLCWTTLAAHVGGDTLTTTIAWACAACGEFELSRDAADLLDHIRRSDPARSRRLGAAVSRHLDELRDPITTVAILRLESKGS
jgi:hypothetical protein